MTPDQFQAEATAWIHAIVAVLTVAVGAIGAGVYFILKNKAVIVRLIDDFRQLRGRIDQHDVRLEVNTGQPTFAIGHADGSMVTLHKPEPDGSNIEVRTPPAGVLSMTRSDPVTQYPPMSKGQQYMSERDDSHVAHSGLFPSDCPLCKALTAKAEPASLSGNTISMAIPTPSLNQPFVAADLEEHFASLPIHTTSDALHETPDRLRVGVNDPHALANAVIEAQAGLPKA